MMSWLNPLDFYFILQYLHILTDFLPIKNQKEKKPA